MSRRRRSGRPARARTTLRVRTVRTARRNLDLGPRSRVRRPPTPTAQPRPRPLTEVKVEVKVEVEVEVEVKVEYPIVLSELRAVPSGNGPRCADLVEDP
ncbi:hypothetical protein NKG05_10145 [Oerskovia sp. M15]